MSTAPALTDRPYSKTQLFCSNLPWSVNGKVKDAQMLRQAFEVYGEVTDAFVAYNGRSSRGFGYVTFKEAAGAALAVEKMNGQPLGDDDRSREIRVEMARERPGPRPEPREPRSGGNSERRQPREDGEGGKGSGGGGRGGRGRGRDGEGGGEGKGDRPRRPRSGRGKGGGEGEGGGKPREAVAEVTAAVAEVAVSEPPAVPAVEESSES